jgi:peptidoglycan hydrolase CwlO-like protein
MEKNDKYITMIAVLITLLIFNIVAFIISIVIATDLRDTVQRYTNSLDVCRIDLEEIQKENEELREEIEELR